jgi:hypothetical protein
MKAGIKILFNSFNINIVAAISAVRDLSIQTGIE